MSTEIFINHSHLYVMAITGLVVVIAVLIHFEFLSMLTALLPRLVMLSRMRIIVLMFSLLFIHVVEIWLFAFGYLAMSDYPQLGHLQGTFSSGLLDFAYYSAVSYTSLGFGDMLPIGPIRFMTAMETLTGLVMIGWSASFMYIEMQRFWRRD